MRRRMPPLPTHLLLAIALCHLFGDMAFAGSAILCIGANDHRALEMEHLAGQGCESTTLQSSSPIEATAPDSERRFGPKPRLARWYA